MPSVSLSGEHNLTFLHIPKCGGSSVVTWLRNINAEYATKKNLSVLPNKITEILGHPYLSDIREKHPTNFTFTTVRNPWDRTVSGYFYVLNTVSDSNRAAVMKLNGWETFPSFEEFVKHMHCYKTIRLDARASGNQMSWIDAPVDLIIKMEDLDSGLQPIKDMFETTTSIHRENTSLRKLDYKHYYNTETQKIVEKHCQLDIDTWGYTF